MVEMVEETTTKYYTLAEVAKSNGKDTDKTWIIYRDGVYDCTKFIADHPGGAELIMEWAGKDATKEFDDFGHSGDAKRELKRLKIGEIVEEERKKKQKKVEKETKEIFNGPKIVESNDHIINRSCIHIITCGLLV